jgi:2,3-bisphosphoglycerate-independent phosphoglycerate mutase
MKAAEITDACIDAVRSGRYDHVRLNYANGDMVGHTGNLAATRVAVAAVDLELARLEAAVREAGGVLLITADHGNADRMWARDKQGDVARHTDGSSEPLTSHTLSPVPFYVVDASHAYTVRTDLPAPSIANVGATILALLGLTPPHDWLPSLVRGR